MSDGPDPPILIVTSRLGDEYLWAEALNPGAYDVLAKPFDPSEVHASSSVQPGGTGRICMVVFRSEILTQGLPRQRHCLSWKKLSLLKTIFGGSEKQFWSAVRLMGSWNSDGTFGYMSVPVSSTRKAEDSANVAAIVDLSCLKHMRERTAAFLALLHTFGSPWIAAIVAAYRECSPESIIESRVAAISANAAQSTSLVRKAAA